jgi:hypothetical protein
MRRGLVVGLLLCSCSVAYDSADVIVLHRDAGSFTAGDLSVGGAATVKIEPEGAIEYEGTESVDLRAVNPSIASLRQTILSDTWTILGHTPGEARFRVYVDDTLVDDFVMTVVPFEEFGA